MTEQVHVAVGVLLDDQERVFIARRPLHAHQGGLWEFPGGKVEPDEPVQHALQREFQEEIGITPLAPVPLLKIAHAYADKSVLLDVWLFQDYSGTPEGKEGQAIEWRSIADLRVADFPAANAPILKALGLPAELAITPELASWPELAALLTRYKALGLRLIQLLQKRLDRSTYIDWYLRACEFCSLHNIRLMANADPDWLDSEVITDWHCSARALTQLNSRPVAADSLFSVACHNRQELALAEQAGADFVLLSPVSPTKSYRPEDCLGWTGFTALANTVSLPVYALGGLQREDLSRARQAGAIGLAGITAYLS